MNFLKNIFTFFKKMFNKENDIKMIDAPMETASNAGKINFINSLKINMNEKKKKKVETLTCVGDGLGIQNKITF